MVDNFVPKEYDVNLVYSGSYDSKSSYEIRSNVDAALGYDFAAVLADRLSKDLGLDRVYYPERDMLGGVNLFEEFYRVACASLVTVLIVSKDIGQNPWYTWLNQMSFKRTKDHLDIKLICVGAPGVNAVDLTNRCSDFMLVDSVVYVPEGMPNAAEAANKEWYRKLLDSVKEGCGRLPRQMSSELASAPPVQMSREESGTSNSTYRHNFNPLLNDANSFGVAHELPPTYEEATDGPNVVDSFCLPGVKSEREQESQPLYVKESGDIPKPKETKKTDPEKPQFTDHGEKWRYVPWRDTLIVVIVAVAGLLVWRRYR